MQIGIVGLGKMGGNMARRLLRDGHEVFVFDRSAEPVRAAEGEGAIGGASLEELVGRMTAPRAIWIMVPAGDPTEETVRALGELLQSEDTVVDGGNSKYSDSVRRAALLADKGVSFIDAGTSGGIWGLSEGYCLMIGAEPAAFDRLEPVFKSLAPRDGYAHVGPPGAGHFVKMVHNGVEYALMQAYAEGFELLKLNGEFDINVAQVAEVWRQGSVVRSWLLDLAARALKDDPELASMSDWVEDSGEGRWTVQTALEHSVPAPTIALSLFARFASRQEESFAGKMLAALRHEFGGHPVHEKKK
jgi:6-phosphogluconate dehydrogenase